MSSYRGTPTTSIPQNLVPSQMTAYGASSSYTVGDAPFQYTPGLNTPVPNSNTTLYRGRDIPLAFINRLPSEVLELIFLNAIWIPGYPVWDRIPIFISQVCTRWRSIALRLSALWSCIILPDTKFRPSLHAFPIWLERAREQGLRVILRSKQAHLVPTLSSIIHRCEHLILDLREETASAATAIPFANASRLQSIEILFHDRNIQAVERICSNIGFAQRLKAITIAANRLSSTSPLLTRPWPCLTSLTMKTRISGSQLASIAKNISQLTHLDIHLLALGQPNTDCIQFPHLKSLSMIVTWDPISEYFDVLSVPSLESLDASCGYSQNDPKLSRSFDNFLSRSIYPLECLSLDFPSERDICDCIQIPSLRHLHQLHLSCSNTITDMTAKLLLITKVSQSPSILPYLRSLSMDPCATSDGVVSSILASRFQHGQSRTPRSLKFASIDFWGSRDSDTGYTGCHDRDEQAFDRLIEKGLDIRGRWIFYRKLKQKKRGMNMY